MLVACVAMTAGLAIVTASPAAAGNGFCGNAALKSRANGMYLSAELGYGGNLYGALRARSSSIGPWERFELCQRTEVIMGAPSYISTLQSLANGKFVSADWNLSGSQRGILRAGWATTAQGWEFFQIDAGNHPAKIFVTSGLVYASAEMGYPGDLYGVVRARAANVGLWEQYDVVAA